MHRRAMIAGLPLAAACAAPASAQAVLVPGEIEVLFRISDLPGSSVSDGTPSIRVDGSAAVDDLVRRAAGGGQVIPYLDRTRTTEGVPAAFRLTRYSMLPPSLQIRSQDGPLMAEHMAEPPMLLVTPYRRDGVRRIAVLLQTGTEGHGPIRQDAGGMTRLGLWAGDVALGRDDTAVLVAPSKTGESSMLIAVSLREDETR